MISDPRQEIGLHASSADAVTLTVKANIESAAQEVQPQGDVAAKRQGINIRFLATATALAVFELYLLVIWFDLAPGLRGWKSWPEGWTLYTFPYPDLASVVTVIACFAAIVGTILVTERAESRPWAASARRKGAITTLYLIVMVTLGYGLQLSLLKLKGDNPNYNLTARVTDSIATGYYHMAIATPNLSGLFVDYVQNVKTFNCGHCPSHPPAPVLFYWASLRLAEALPPDWRHNIITSEFALPGGYLGEIESAHNLSETQILGAFIGGSLLLALTSMCVIPALGLARLLAPLTYSYRLAALALALPSMLLINPSFDAIYALFTASSLYLGLQGLRSTSKITGSLWALASGLVIAVAIFFSWGTATFLVAMALLGVVCFFGSRKWLFPTGVAIERMTLSHAALWLGALVVGSALPIILLDQLGQLKLAELFGVSMSNVAAVEAGRPYLVWIFYAPFVYFQTLGLPLTLATLLATMPFSQAHWDRIRASFRKSVLPNSPRPVDVEPKYLRINLYAALFWVMLVGIDVLGKNRAEYERLLVFLMPMALLAVFWWVGRVRPQPRMIMWLVLAQMTIVGLLGARWLM